MKRAVIFDVDGTLLDTTEGVLSSAAYNRGGEASFFYRTSDPGLFCKTVWTGGGSLAGACIHVQRTL